MPLPGPTSSALFGLLLPLLGVVGGGGEDNNVLCVTFLLLLLPLLGLGGGGGEDNNVQCQTFLLLPLLGGGRIITFFVSRSCDWGGGGGGEWGRGGEGGRAGRGRGGGLVFGVSDFSTRG